MQTGGEKMKIQKNFKQYILNLNEKKKKGGGGGLED